MIASAMAIGRRCVCGPPAGPQCACEPCPPTAYSARRAGRRGEPLGDSSPGAGAAALALITTMRSPGWKTLTPPESNRCETPLRMTVSTISPRAVSRAGRQADVLRA